jgi:hypothetical protein
LIVPIAVRHSQKYPTAAGAAMVKTVIRKSDNSEIFKQTIPTEPHEYWVGAGEGNRTLVSKSPSCHPVKPQFYCSIFHILMYNWK